MRIIYFDDIKRGFKVTKNEVIFKGKLFLNQVPKNPTDAVDKEYVDMAFSDGVSLIVDNLIETDPDYQLKGDLVKTPKKQEYKLSKVIAKGRYCNVTVDSKGRVIKGLTYFDKIPNMTLKDIPFSSLDFKDHVGLGHRDNEGLSYKDWLNDKPKHPYLNIHFENKLSVLVRVEVNLFEKNGVLNELGVEELLNLIIDPRLKFLKHDGYEGILKDKDYDEALGIIDFNNPELKK